MKQVVIENPILNSPFAEPTRHFRFSDEGITDEIVNDRRISSYFVPIAQPKKKKGKETQLVFDTEWTQDRVEENNFINQVRARVAMWREGHYPGVTKTTAKLLEYWTDPTREPYDKLKRALRAEIDEAAWSALYSTKSQPFDPPETGKIAVKVINHYGDEVLKVYEPGKE